MMTTTPTIVWCLIFLEGLKLNKFNRLDFRHLSTYIHCLFDNPQISTCDSPGIVAEVESCRSIDRCEKGTESLGSEDEWSVEMEC